MIDCLFLGVRHQIQWLPARPFLQHYMDWQQDLELLLEEGEALVWAHFEHLPVNRLVGRQ